MVPGDSSTINELLKELLLNYRYIEDHPGVVKDVKGFLFAASDK